jgi:uncharacterized DUF497 family protein
MSITFDPAKDAANIAKHGVSLAQAEELELLKTVVDERFEYGETRYLGYGYIDGLGYCFVFTVRGDDVRAISLRRARAKEMNRYVP